MKLIEISYWSRQFIKFGFILIVLAVIGGAVLKTAWGIYRSIIPPPVAAPTVGYGKLSPIPFPKKQKYNYKYTLETPTGELPKFPTTANVYLMPQFQSSFLRVDEATEIARNLGFTNKMEKVTETIYRFEHPEVPKTMDINIINKTFSISYNLAAKPELLNLKSNSKDTAQIAIESFLSSSNLLTDEYKGGQISVEYLKSNPPELVTANAQSESNFIRVNFFRKNYADLPVVTPSRTQANVWFIVSGDGYGSNQIIAGEYHHFPVDESNSSTYPIKSSDQAWKELIEGNAVIIKPLPSGQTDVVIRRIGLAYYDAGEAQQFFQPVIVFEGDNGFTAYLPAVTTEFQPILSYQ